MACFTIPSTMVRPLYWDGRATLNPSAQLVHPQVCTSQQAEAVQIGIDSFRRVWHFRRLCLCQVKTVSHPHKGRKTSVMPFQNWTKCNCRSWPLLDWLGEATTTWAVQASFFMFQDFLCDESPKNHYELPVMRYVLVSWKVR